MTTPMWIPPDQAWQNVQAAATHAMPSVKACIVAAACVADQIRAQTVADQTGDAQTRSIPINDTGWARIALAAYEQLRQGRAHAHLDVSALLRCTVETHRVRRWLTRLSDLPGFTHQSVAQTWAITDDDFHWEADDIATKLSTLVDQAQKAGVYGVPGYTISLRHVTSGDFDEGVEHQVTLQTRPARSSPRPACLATTWSTI